jgi:hypothetical protein
VNLIREVEITHSGEEPIGPVAVTYPEEMQIRVRPHHRSEGIKKIIMALQLGEPSHGSDDERLFRKTE